MKVIDPGHQYLLDTLDGKPGLKEFLRFVKRTGDIYPGNDRAYPGTNCQEVIRALIDRLKYIDSQIHDYRNQAAISQLRDVLWLLESRAADRHGLTIRNEDVVEIESLPTCPHCGHIVCGRWVNNG